jgi:hypothetical protein
MRHRIADRPAQTCIAWVFVVMLLTVTIGCSSSTTPSASVMPSSDEAAAPKGNAIPDPVLREARDQAEIVLLGLLSGEFDEDENLSLVAEKVKGYTSWSIKSQNIVRKGTAEFKGALSSPAGKAGFSMTLVKQPSGTWAIGTFSGPDVQ